MRGTDGVSKTCFKHSSSSDSAASCPVFIVKVPIGTAAE